MKPTYFLEERLSTSFLLLFLLLLLFPHLHFLLLAHFSRESFNPVLSLLQFIRSCTFIGIVDFLWLMCVETIVKSGWVCGVVSSSRLYEMMNGYSLSDANMTLPFCGTLFGYQLEDVILQLILLLSQLLNILEAKFKSLIYVLHLS